MSTSFLHFYLFCLEEKRLGLFIKRVFGRYKDKVGIYGTRTEKASALGMVLCKEGRLEGECRLVEMLCLELYVPMQRI